MLPCENCYTLDWRTMIAHLMMCNYADGIASQDVVEAIEDTHALLDTAGLEGRISLLLYPRGGVGQLHLVAEKLGLSAPIVSCYRLQWLRRLAAELEARDLLTLSRPVIDCCTPLPRTDGDGINIDTYQYLPEAQP